MIDGCPAGLEISEEEIREALKKRAPGRDPHTSPRKEPDAAEIYSGVFEGKTTGAPISIFIPNKDADPSKYNSIKDFYRPGHANFTYLEKYGIFDHRGGGRASGRETACRVAAGAVAKKLLKHFGITCTATLDEACDIAKIKDEGDSVGGVVSFRAVGLFAGLGDPIYEKLEAKLADAMLSIPASKGFEMGEGFQAAVMRGSSHNDPFILEEGRVVTQTNHAGGTLGGISTGMPLYGKVAFKPASSIQSPQETVTLDKEAATFQLPEGSRHDPCVAIRATPVVEAMLALVLADALLLHRSSRL